MSKSLMTPSFNGRTAMIDAGVRPTIRLASAPIARIAPVRASFATTEGSLMTMPRPRTWTSVFAVPRSTPTSRETKPKSESSKWQDPFPDVERSRWNDNAPDGRLVALADGRDRCRCGGRERRRGRGRPRRRARRRPGRSGRRSRCRATGRARRTRALGRGRARYDHRRPRPGEPEEADRLIPLVVRDDAVHRTRRRLLVDPHRGVRGVRPCLEEADVAEVLGVAAGREVHRVTRAEVLLADRERDLPDGRGHVRPTKRGDR